MTSKNGNPSLKTWDEIRSRAEAVGDGEKAFDALRSGLQDWIDGAVAAIGAAGPGELEDLRNLCLGRKRGLIKQAMAHISKVPAANRGEFGALLNEGKRRIQDTVKSREKSLATGKAATSRSVDITLPGRRPPIGSIHPLTQTFLEMARSFARLGFSWVSGPEVESARYNFDGLNIPPGHPARDAEENFMISPEVLLRTQTSTVQVRVMEAHRPPLRIIAPGRVYRPDTVDATHHFMFHQVEGLMIDENVSYSDLKTVLGLFVRDLFGPEVKMRLRPSFFPFTEPSAEMETTCTFCEGTGCTVCKGVGWIETAGCGMVDPAVLEFAKIDPDRFSGFAFGIGIDRIAMIRHQIQDIRLFTENDVRFLAQF